MQRADENTENTGGKRISLIRLAALTGLPLFARFRDMGKNLALGAYDLQSVQDGFWVGLFLSFAMWAICITSDTILELGSKGLGQPVLGSQIPINFTRYVGVALAIALNFMAVLYASRGNRIPAATGF